MNHVEKSSIEKQNQAMSDVINTTDHSSASPQQQITQLLNGIQQDHRIYSQLLVLLVSQRTMIVERQSDPLENLNQLIEQIYQQLKESTNQRLLLLKSLNIPAQSDGMHALFSRLPNAMADKARGLWQQLEQQAINCKQLNESNTQLLMMQQEILNRLLNNEAELIYQP